MKMMTVPSELKTPSPRTDCMHALSLGPVTWRYSLVTSDVTVRARGEQTFLEV